MWKMSKESMILVIGGDGGRGEIGKECKPTSRLTASCGNGGSKVDGSIVSTSLVGSTIMSAVGCSICGVFLVQSAIRQVDG